MSPPNDQISRPSDGYGQGLPSLSRSDELRMSNQLASVCVMGATGLLGQSLCGALERSGVKVYRYSRSARPGFVSWDPSSGKIDMEPLEHADVVVNLAGEDIAGARWSAERKRMLRESRLASTQLLVQTLGMLKRPPGVLINASAVGFYGHRGEDAVSEISPAGTGFLAELCQAWEAAAMQATAHGVRVVLPRLGVVLSKEGGALARMLPAFKLGVAGKLGSGRQFMSWISLPDAVSVLRFLMSASEIQGAVNAVAPEPITNEEFTETLGRVVRRPTLLTVPNFALKAALGELSQVLLEGANVRPRVLELAGFRFDYPRLEDALEMLVG